MTYECGKFVFAKQYSNMGKLFSVVVKKCYAHNASITRFFRNFALGKVTLNKRIGRLLNNDASEPGGAEAIVFFRKIWRS